MSDPEVPQPERRKDVDDVVDSANAGLDAAEAARGDVPTTSADTAAPAAPAADDVPAPRTRPEVDPDLAAFEAAERDHPGTFTAPTDNERRDSSSADADATAVYTAPVARDSSSMASAAYSAPDDTETRVVPSEPVVADTVVAEPVVAPAFTQQPIFVQAPEPPRERGNRGTAGAIGLLATIAFAILYLGTTLGLGAWMGDVTAENIGESALAPLTTWGFWVPVVVFFLGFWLLGAFINRGRWGLWVVFGIIVGVISYAGHLLGQLFEAPFWLLSAREANELLGEQLFAPLAIAAFVFGRELTIWFGAWVARSGARKTELNTEAQREYERTLEAGPTLSR